MKLTSTVISLVSLFSIALADQVKYDISYGNGESKLTNVACSDGANGLLSKGFTSYNSLPSFPNIGAAKAVEGWNSTACGSCWNITYKDKWIAVTAIDHADDSFNLALQAMDTLTDGHAKELGVIDAQASQIDKSHCGL